MLKYKGYYVDHVFFHSKEEIDKFIKDKAVWAYKNALTLFMNHPDFAHSTLVDEKAEYLVNHLGFSWEQIDKLDQEWIRE